MKHYGDITKLNGADVPPVNVITGGSPCQDLSVAGKRAGLSGERSGLFMEQIRLIREMRENDRKKGRTDESIRPRYMVWENVPGAFSSNKGEDFRAVLEETARIAEPDAVIPRLQKGQKWSSSGCILGDGWSIAWRVHDAQFWGVPQRRKRIALVADFGGNTAPEILFERKGLSGDIETGRQEGQGITENVERSIRETSAVALENHPNDSRVKISEDGKVQTLSSRMGTGGGNVPMVMYPEKTTGSLMASDDKLGTQEALNDMYIVESSTWDGGQVSPTLTANNAGDSQRMPDKENFNAVIQSINGDIAGTLDASYYKGCDERQGIEREVVAYGLDRASFNQGQNAKYDFSIEEEKIGAQVARGPGAVCRSVVRRLTPLECERLQGFPDYWTDIGEWTDSKGKKHKDADSPRYKALGNSIALPFWEWMAKRIAAHLSQGATMASLFDGIGGFPLVFSRVGIKPVWASEIEEFPIAVTKKHFKEEI